jgi:hypothetical protein
LEPACSPNCSAIVLGLGGLASWAWARLLLFLLRLLFLALDGDGLFIDGFFGLGLRRRGAWLGFSVVSTLSVFG